MSNTWIVAALYILIVLSLGLIVWWEFQRTRKRKLSKPTADPECRPERNTLPVD